MRIPKQSRHRRAAGPLEKVIEKKVCDYARDTYGVAYYKFTSPQRRSVPDRILFWPGGAVCLIEFKRKGERPTDGQTREIERLMALGHTVLVIDDIDFGKLIIDALAKRFKTTTG